jgi:hypothetical protein
MTIPRPGRPRLRARTAAVPLALLPVAGGLAPVGAWAWPDASAPEAARSWVVGTSALTALLLVAALLTVLRPLPSPAALGRRRLLVVGAVAVACQAAHAVEEWAAGFWEAFPRLLGLPPWGARTFLVFNLAWVLVWVLSLVGVKRGWRLAEWPLWFLGLALLANGVAHPLLSVLRGRYFPGLATSPVVGIAGLLLLREMLVSSARAPSAAAELR